MSEYTLNKWITIQRGLHDWLLPIWTLKYAMKCRLFYKELTRNWVGTKPQANFIGRKSHNAGEFDAVFLEGVRSVSGRKIHFF